MIGLLHAVMLCSLPIQVFTQSYNAQASGTHLGGSTGQIEPLQLDSPPPEICGRCTASCVPNPDYPCVYTPTYPVWFWPNGSFYWQSPYANGSFVEVGDGRFLSTVELFRESNGFWHGSWYGGNRVYYSDGQNATHCACYYAHGSGMGGPWLLSNYGVADVWNVQKKSIEAVCSKYQCPSNNASAFERWGHAWMESYQSCDRSGAAEHSYPSQSYTLLLM